MRLKIDVAKPIGNQFKQKWINLYDAGSLSCSFTF